MGLDDIIGLEMATGYDQYGYGDPGGMGMDIVGGDFSGDYAALAPYAGAVSPQHPAGRLGLQAQHKASVMAAVAARHAAALVPRAALKAREYTLGFSGAPVAIAAAATSVLKAQPQVPFKGRRLIIPSDVAGALQINNLIIGKNPVLVSADPVSARAYTELGVGVDLNMDTAQIAQVISLSLTNNSGASVSVIPTLIGTAME